MLSCFCWSYIVLLECKKGSSIRRVLLSVWFKLEVESCPTGIGKQGKYQWQERWRVKSLTQEHIHLYLENQAAN